MTEALLFSHTANRFSPKASFRGTVSRILSSCRLRGMERIIYLSSLTRVSVPCGTRSGQLLEPPIWPCTRRGFPCPGDLSPSGGLLHHLFTLTEPCGPAVYSLWHFPSARLETRSPHVLPLARITWRRVLWCSDFPLRVSSKRFSVPLKPAFTIP